MGTNARVKEMNHQYSKCPKLPYTKLSNKMAYANMETQIRLLLFSIHKISKEIKSEFCPKKELNKVIRL